MAKLMRRVKRNSHARFVSDAPVNSHPAPAQLITGHEIADLLNTEFAAKDFNKRVTSSQSEDRFTVTDGQDRCQQCFGPPDGTEYLLPVRGDNEKSRRLIHETQSQGEHGYAVLHSHCWRFFGTHSARFVDREAYGRRVIYERFELPVARDDDDN
jgi:hypothetical protein